MSAAENRFTHDRVEQPHNVRVRGLSRPGTDKMCEETLHPSAGASVVWSLARLMVMTRGIVVTKNHG